MKAPESKRRFLPPGCLSAFFILCILAILFCIALGPMGPSMKMTADGTALQKARSIGLLLFSYANDHDGNYPDGKSSTEVFQKLLDERDADDPAVFFIPMPGKVRPVPGQKLKPENVSFDVTWGITTKSPDELPVAFMTGYRVDYSPGGAAVPRNNIIPRFGMEDSTPGFTEWLTGWHWPHFYYYPNSGGIAVCYVSNRTFFLNPGEFGATMINGVTNVQVDPAAASKDVMPKFISPDFKRDGKTYIQLTPDGPISP